MNIKVGDLLYANMKTNQKGIWEITKIDEGTAIFAPIVYLNAIYVEPEMGRERIELTLNVPALIIECALNSGLFHVFKPEDAGLNRLIGDKSGC